MKRVCIFCASNLGNQPIYAQTAFEVGQTLGENNLDLIYGGASVGLMGKLADGALSKNGNVIGIIPKFLKTKEIEHTGITELITVNTMHERKAKMHEMSDAFIALPGGFGTMEELFEILTWAQLNLHQKPIGILNTNGYYNSLLKLIETMIQEGIVKENYKNLLLVSEDIHDLLSQLNLYQASNFTKWDTIDEVV